MATKNNKIITWPDFSGHGFVLRVVETSLNQKVIIPVLKKNGKYIPYNNKINHHALTQCGFRFINGIYWREASSFSISSFQKTFPKIKPAQYNIDQLVIKKPYWASKFWHIGVNNRAENVYLDFNALRAVSIKDKFFLESGGHVNSRFLRAFSHEQKGIDAISLNECCDGFIIACVSKKMSRQELIMLASSVSGRKVDEFHPNYKIVNDAVEAAIHRSIRSFKGNARSKFEYAQLLYNNQPKLDARTSTSVKLQQFSTPAPMSSVLGNIVNRLKPIDNKHVFEPCVGTGSLIAPIEGIVKTSAIELDHRRVQYARSLSESMSVIEGNATQLEYYDDIELADVVVANPPFGSIKKKIINKTAITRIDHEICMNALGKMKNNGISVFIIGADTFMPKRAGIVSGGSKFFFNYLYSHYYVKDIVELSGSLYAGQGASYPTRMIVIDGRKKESDSELAPEKLSIIENYDALWDWSHSVSIKDDLIIIQDAVDETVHEDYNQFQTVYNPASKVESTQDALIPKNLASPVFNALSVIEQEFGNIDKLVCQELQMDEEDLRNYFSAAQVDGIALSIASLENGGSMIIGDQTGFGKGRAMAAMMRYMILKGKKPVFITEKANLFSDMARDLSDIGSLDMVNPLILNVGKDANIQYINDQGKEYKINASAQKSDRDEFISSGSLPDNMNALFMTYTQINRVGSNKASALHQFTKTTESGIIMDEAHNAAGDSNINTNLSYIVGDNNVPCVFASATAVKTHKNMNIYLQSMNLPYTTEELVAAGEKGGESFLQIMTTMLAHEGMLIRREYSMDNVKFSKHEPSDESLNMNFVFATEIATILRNISVLSGEVAAIIADKRDDIKDVLKCMSSNERKGNRMGVSYIGFGSSLHNLNRQLMLAMRSKELIDEIINDVNNGKKPVIALDHTMDSLIEHVMGDPQYASGVTEDGGIIINTKITMAIALKKSAERLLWYISRNALGITRKVKTDNPDILAWYDRIVKDIDRSPLLLSTSLTIFDDIRNALEVKGISVAEVSGRKYRVSNKENGIIVRNSPLLNRTNECARFNDGNADVILLSGAGSTGISLHASEKFKDQRPRVMHIAQANQDISRFIQILGRVNRNGQVCHPEIKFHTSGITGEKRELGALVSKLASLMASSTANRESHIDILIDGTVDIVNSLGDECVAELLGSNIDIAKHLDIDMEDFQDIEGIARKFLGRMTLLNPGAQTLDMIDLNNPSDKDVISQIFVFHKVMDMFNNKLDELTAQGRNPFAIENHDWHAKTLRRELYSGDDSIDNASPFNAPSYIEEIEFEVLSNPITFERVELLVNAASKRNIKNMDIYYKHKDGHYIDPAVILKENRYNILKSYLSPFNHEDLTDSDVDNAIESMGSPHVYHMSEQIDRIIYHIKLLGAGSPIDMNIGSDKVKGVITNFKIPQPHELHRASSYGVSVAIEGREHVSNVTLNWLMEMLDVPPYVRNTGITKIQDMINKPDNEVFQYQLKKIKNGYDRFPIGKHLDKRVVLTGNMIEASMADKGSLTTFINDKNQRVTAFLLPYDSKFNAVVREGVKFRDAKTLAMMLRYGKIRSLSNMMDYSSKLGIYISKFRSHDYGDAYKLHVPGNKKYGDKYFNNEALVNFIGDFSGSRSLMGVIIPENKIDKAMELILNICKSMHLKGDELKYARQFKDGVRKPYLAMSNSENCNVGLD